MANGQFAFLHENFFHIYYLNTMKRLSDYLLENIADVTVTFKGKAKDKRKIIVLINNKKYVIEKFDHLPSVPKEYDAITRKIILKNWYWFFGWDISAKDFYNYYKNTDTPYTLEDEYDEINRSLDKAKKRYLRNDDEYHYLKKNLISDYYKNRDKYPSFFDIKELLVNDKNNVNNFRESLINVHSDFFKDKDYDRWLLESFDEVDDNIDEDKFYSLKYINGDVFYQFKPNYQSYSTALYERLKDSMEINDVIEKKILSFKGITNISYINKKKLAFIITVNKEFDKDEFTHYANFLGYAISREDNDEILYEATVPRRIKCNDKYLYHVTDKSRLDKILRYGLIPKSNKDENDGLRYPERVYLWRQDTKHIDMKMFYDIHFRNNNCVILKIDLQRMRKDGIDISLFTDCAYNIPNAIFTLEPIRTKYISKC